jgi:hypothetical protein
MERDGMSYARNVKLWAKGFGRFDELDFKTGWSSGQVRWWLVYTLNMGTRVLTGGAVVTWSRWFYETRYEYRLSKLMTRLLNHADDDHGAESGPALWGSEATDWAGMGGLLFWTGVVGLVLWLIVR